jgi:hypothetical protein
MTATPPGARNDAQGLNRFTFSPVTTFDGFEFTRQQIYLHANTTLANNTVTIAAYLQGGFRRPQGGFAGSPAQGYSFQSGTGRFNATLLMVNGFSPLNDARYYLHPDTPIDVLNALNNNGTRFIRRTVNTGSTTRFGAERICTGSSTAVTCPP